VPVIQAGREKTDEQLGPRKTPQKLLLASNSPFKQGIGQLKALMFVGPGIEDHQRTRTKTFDLADGMLAKPTTIV
jgi:hypothetical protein